MKPIIRRIGGIDGKTKDDGCYPFGWRWHKGREIL